MIGSVLGNYRVTAKIGQGGMGVVYLAEHVTIGRRAAIKVLLPERSTDEQQTKRFFNEARATARLNHPALIDIYDFGVAEDGRSYIVMELLDGESLTARLARQERLSAGDALDVARQIAAGLEVAHRNGIVHRDLSPNNVFLLPAASPGGRAQVKVLDFGIAKLMEPDGAGGVTTRSNLVLGTPYYMAPEQCRGTDAVDHRADIYALGCILYAMLCGRPPFNHKGPGEVIAAHIYESPPRPRSLAPDIPPALEALLLRALAKSPAERPTSMAEMHAALAEVEAQMSPPQLARPTAPAPDDAPPARTITVGDLPLAPSAVRVARRRTALVWRLAGLAVALAAVALIVRSATRRGEETGVVEAQPIGRVEAGPTALPFVASDGKGHAVVVWRQNDGKRYNIWGNGYAPRTGWAKPVLIEQDERGDARSAIVDMDGNGRAVAVWRQSDGTRYRLWASTYDVATGRFAAPTVIDQPDAGDVVGNDFAMDQEGRGYAAWAQGGGGAGRQNIWVARYVPGRGFTTPHLLERNDDGHAEDPEVSVGGGKAVVVWKQEDGERKNVWGNQLESDDQWGQPRLLEHLPEMATDPEVELNERGDGCAVWRQTSNFYSSIWAARFSPSSGWSEAEVIERRGGDVTMPLLGIDASGRCTVVWNQEDGIRANVWVSRLEPGVGWGEPIRLDRPDHEQSHRPAVSVSRAGEAVVVWSQGEEKDQGIWANRFDPTARTWGGAFRLDRRAERAKEAAVVVRGGTAFAVWVQACGSQTCPFGAVLEPATLAAGR